MRYVRLACFFVLVAGCPAPTDPPGMDGGTDAPALDAPGSDTPADGGTSVDAGGDAPSGCADPDEDGDGVSSIACGGTDCDDTDPNRAPGRTEVCDALDHDEDCEPTTYGVRDADGDDEPDAACCNVAADDTRHCGTDCDDVRAGVSPTATETCNGRDDNCNAMIDEGVLLSFSIDGDGDGFGTTDASMTTMACSAPAGYVGTGGDCVDTNANINPARGEICGNGVDDNCNMMQDETGTVTFYRDMDDDGRGNVDVTMVFTGCSDHPGWSAIPGDCDDTRATTYDGAPELCNLRDDNCDRVGGRGGPDPEEDNDGDGHYELCVNADDCNDTQATTFVGAPELCNRVDDDCSVTAMPGGVDPLEDADSDGHSPTAATCSGGFLRDDCRDDAATIYTLAPELCNRIDENCSAGGGVETSEDTDDDGFAPLGGACAGGPLPETDCNDTNAAIRPGAAETCDGVDTDCDWIADGPAPTAASCSGGTSCIAGECTTLYDLAAGFAHSCLVTATGRVMCWGANGGNNGDDGPDGRLGVGLGPASAIPRVLHPRMVPGITDALTVTIGAGHTCVRHRDNGVSCWGLNNYGQLGDGTTTLRTAPTRIAGLSVTHLDAGLDHTCALTTDLRLVCWGRGQGGAPDVRVPTAFASAPTFTAGIDLSAGTSHSCMTVTVAPGDNRSYCWGSGALGRLGNGAMMSSPVPSLHFMNVGEIEAHDVGTCFTTGGAVRCHGYNEHGAVGNEVALPGTDVLSWSIVRVPPLSGSFVLPLTASGGHVCGRVTGTGNWWCWGLNGSGQLGDGTMTSRSTPTAVMSLPAMAMLSAGGNHTCARSGRGFACWGANAGGQLGDTTTTSRATVPSFFVF